MENKVKSKEQVIDLIKRLKFKKLNAMRCYDPQLADNYESVIERLIKTVTNFDDMLSELSVK
jgi:hypothetical protein